MTISTTLPRDRILTQQKVKKTEEYCYKINSAGHYGDHVEADPPEGKLYKPNAEVTIVFIDEKFASIKYNFGPENCSSERFWLEIQAAIADEVGRLIDSYVRPRNEI